MASDSTISMARTGSSSTQQGKSRRGEEGLLTLVLVEDGADWAGWSEPSWRHLELSSLFQRRHESPRGFAVRVRSALGEVELLGRRMELAVFVPAPTLSAEVVTARLLIMLAVAMHLGAHGGGVLLLDDRTLDEDARCSLEAVGAVVSDEVRRVGVAVVHASNQNQLDQVA